MALQVDTKFNIGAAVGLLLTASVMYGNQQAQIATLNATTLSQGEQIVAINATIRDRAAIREADSTAMKARIGALEVQYAGVSADVRNILNIVSDIKEAQARGQKP